MNLVALAIMLGAIPPARLKGSKLLAITFNAGALEADITGNVYDRFNRLSNSVLHD
jgi:hypothetical protein